MDLSKSPCPGMGEFLYFDKKRPCWAYGTSGWVVKIYLCSTIFDDDRLAQP